jgi:AraC-like DNA-binding protein
VKEALFSNTVIYDSGLVRIGAFRCDRAHPGFRDTGPAKNDCFVFPRTAVEIEHEDAPPFVATPNIVTFYNRSQHYLRHEISDRGDRCDWFGVRRDLAIEAAGGQPGEAPFRCHRSRCDAKTYLLQRRLFDAVAAGKLRDPVAIDETVLGLLHRVAGARLPLAAERVHDVEALLAARFDQRLNLSQIAAHAGSSPYHLCRMFRQATGYAIHQYLRQLRIRHGLESVCETADPLDRIAVDLGFAHHSHFTSAFRRDFEITPLLIRNTRPEWKP